MDVRCAACGTLYELDEARVPDDGLQVKCSKCATVFRAMKPAAGVAVPAPGSSEDWTIRQVDGTTIRFKELTTLQRWIVERKVAREDEISRTGAKWEKLGNIPELAVFFQVVEASTRAQPVMLEQPSPRNADTERNVALSPAQPVPAPQPSATPLGYAAPLSAAPAGERRVRSVQLDNLPSGPNPAQEPATNVHHNIAIPYGALPTDEDDLVLPGRNRGKIAAGVIVALAALAGLGYLANPALFTGAQISAVPPDVLQAADIAYEKLGRDSYAALDEAIAGFERVVAAAPAYAAAHAGLAEALAARAEYELEDENEAAARERLQRARAAALQGMRLMQESVAANRAMAEVHRVAGEAAPMKEYVTRAKDLAPNDARLNMLLGEVAAADPSAMERAIRHFDIALEHDPKLNRARYKLAVVYAKNGQPAKAQDHLRRVLGETPEHERAKALLATLVEPPAPAPSAAAVVAEAAPADAEPSAENREPTAEAPKAEPAQSFEQIIASAERARQGDKPGVAVRLYEKALELEPGNAEAHTGMGWCYFDLNNLGAAIASFRKALQISPRFADAHLGLGEAFNARGMKRDAVKHYRAYLDVLPNGPESDVARRMIEQLGGAEQ